MSSFPCWQRPGPSLLAEHFTTEPPCPSLFLLGTMHHDPEGFGRLRRFLDRFDPQLVCVELSPYGLFFRRRFGRALHEILRANLREAARRGGLAYRSALVHPQIISIRRQISLPFEYRAARAYADARRSRLILADWSLFSRRCIEDWPELLAVDNLVQLLRTPSAFPPPAYAYAEAASRIHAPPEPPSLSPDEEDAFRIERESRMARLIERVCRRYAGRPILYVGGWWHLRAGGPWPALRALLHVDASRCFLLDRLPSLIEPAA